jgi:hypothetical protein
MVGAPNGDFNPEVAHAPLAAGGERISWSIMHFARWWETWFGPPGIWYGFAGLVPWMFFSA